LSSIEKTYWYLHNHKIFDQLTKQQLEELSVLVGYFQFGRNELIHLFSDPTKRIYFLKEGLIKIVQKHKDEKGIINGLIHKGDVFGEFTVCKDEDNSHLIVASANAIICTFTLENFEKIIQKYPTISLKICKQFGEKIIEANNKYTDIFFKDSKTRLIEFLADFADRYGEKTATETRTRNYLTQEEIARMIGCKRQTVTLLMRELQREGKISYSREHLTLYSPDFIEKTS